MDTVQLVTVSDARSCLVCVTVAALGHPPVGAWHSTVVASSGSILVSKLGQTRLIGF